MSLKRYLTIYAAREMSFKGNFILWIIVGLLWFALQLCFIGVYICTMAAKVHAAYPTQGNIPW
jgi:hypothetical protein